MLVIVRRETMLLEVDRKGCRRRREESGVPSGGWTMGKRERRSGRSSWTAVFRAVMGWGCPAGNWEPVVRAQRDHSGPGIAAAITHSTTATFARLQAADCSGQVALRVVFGGQYAHGKA